MPDAGEPKRPAQRRPRARPASTKPRARPSQTGAGDAAARKPAPAPPVAPVDEPSAPAGAPEARAATGVDGRGFSASQAYELLWSSGLLNVLTLARRELAALFLSPIAYAVGVAVIVPTSLLGYLQPVLSGEPATMDGVFGWVAFSMVFLTPLFTMRLLAEEERSGTLEQLLTTPVRFWEVVAGKWLAGLVFFLATIAFTLVYVALLAVYQPRLDYGPILTGYAGIVLVGAAWVALGLLASSLTRNQIIAAVTGVVVLLAFQYLLGTAAGFLRPPLSDLLDYASAASHVQSFDQGQIVLRDVVFFLTLTAAALLLTERVLESRQWR